MRIIQSRNHVMARESIPAAYRPSNQARLERSRASNPAASERDAYLPEQGEVRWGNSRGDNGLAPRRLPQVRDRKLQTRMQNITGAPPAVLPRAPVSPLNVPIVPADVAGLGRVPLRPPSETPWWQRQAAAPKPGWSLWRAPVRGEKLPQHMRRVHGTPMSWATTSNSIAMHPTKAATLPRPHDPTVSYATMAQAQVAGFEGLDTPSLLLAAGAALGVFMLIRNR